jgi:hypothetical protein
MNKCNNSSGIREEQVCEKTHARTFGGDSEPLLQRSELLRPVLLEIQRGLLLIIGLISLLIVSTLTK